MTQSGLIAAAYLQVSAADGVLAGEVPGDRLPRGSPAPRLLVASGGLLAASLFVFLSLSQPPHDLTPKSRYSFAVGLLRMLGGI